MEQRRSEYSKREKGDKPWEILGGDDELDSITFQDITQCKNDWDTEFYVKEVLVGGLMEHYIFRCLILFVIIHNAVIISIQTSNPVVTKRYQISFSVCEHVILTAFTWEILVKWFYGFNIYWRTGWNIFDCVVTAALLIGPNVFSYESDIFKVMRVLRVLRSVSTFASMHGVSRMLHVIWQSLPDLANIFLLLIIIMLLFALFGVTLFSTSVPSAFGDLPATLYTLFICITQDGWMDIYNKFSDSSVPISMMYGASVYFIVFLTIGAFIFGNLFGAVVTTNLEISMADMDDKVATSTPEDVGVTTQMTHVEEVVGKTNMTKRQKPWKSTFLEALRMETFEELVLVLSSMEANKKQYKRIRQELDRIVQEVHSLSFNRQQEDALINRDKQAASMKDNFLMNDIATGRTGDMLSTLMTLEKAHVIDSGTDSPVLFQKGMRREALRRLSVSLTIKTKEAKEDAPPSSEEQK